MASQEISLAYSVDADDAFMFHALANDKIPTGNLRFTHELQDIETLNRRAMKGESYRSWLCLLKAPPISGRGREQE